MDFQKLLLDAGKALRESEVKALAFLCADLLGRNPASVESASDLFSRLVDQDHLSAEQPHLLTELLFIIQRARLARHLRLTDQVSVTTSLISPYRRLLYNLSEDLTEGDLKDIKFLLNKQLPRRKLEENVTTLEVFLELEHMDYLSDTNLDLLENVIESVCPMLTGKIKQFKAEDLHRTSHIAQETGQTGSVTDPFGPTQVQQPSDRISSCEIAELQLLAEGINTSLYLPNMCHSGDEFEALSHGLSALSTEASSSRVSSDSQDVFSQENEVPPGKQKSLTTNRNTVLETYRMNAAKRGICLIINNYDYSKSEKDLPKREGTMVDEECLCKVFTWLGFEIETQRDCKSEKMLSVMRELGSRNHSQMDCLVCCILGHGKEESVYGVDGRTVRIRELMEPVNGLNCSSLAEKPKLFFVQACQGTREQKAVYLEADGPERSLVQSNVFQSIYSIPSDADFLLGMATVPSFVSFRDRTKGTWFIQSLCQNLVSMVPRDIDLISILTQVNADVSQKTDSTGVKKQMPQPAFSLTKKVVFPNPSAPPPIL